MQKQDELAIIRAKLANGRQHELAFNVLEENAVAVGEITRKVNKLIDKKGPELRLREVSRALKWLAENNLAYSPNYKPEQGIKGIVYRLTPKGKDLRKFIEKIKG